MQIVVTERALQVIRQLNPGQEKQLLALIKEASSSDHDQFFQRHPKHKIANPQRRVAYIRGPEDLRLVLSFDQDGTVVVEDVLSKQVLSKITGKLIQ